MKPPVIFFKPFIEIPISKIYDHIFFYDEARRTSERESGDCEVGMVILIVIKIIMLQ